MMFVDFNICQRIVIAKIALRDLDLLFEGKNKIKFLYL